MEYSETIISGANPEPGKTLVLGKVPEPILVTLDTAESAAGTTPSNAPGSSKPDLPYFDEVASKHGVKHFVGRQELIHDIHQRIENIDEPTRTVVLQGLGGQGKTAIAVQYAHLHKNSTYKLVFWVDATSEQTMGSACRRIVRERKLIQDVEVVTDRQAVDKVTSYLQKPEAECLVLFDNFDTTNAVEQDHITAILPLGTHPRERVTIIITSRNFGTDAYGPALRIEGMKEEDALDLFLYRWAPKRPVTREHLKACKEILEDVGYLPLAIEQAAAYLHKTRTDPSELLELIKVDREKVIEYVPDNFSYRKSLSSAGGGGNQTSATNESYLNAFLTWDISMKALGGGHYGDPLAKASTSAKMLRLSAFLSREHLPSTLFSIVGEIINVKHFLQWLKVACSNRRGKWERLKFKEFVSELVNLFLVDMALAEDGLEFELTTHPLVQEWARLHQPPDHIAFFFEAAIALMASHMRPDNFDFKSETKDIILSQLDAILRNDDLLYNHDPPIDLPVYLGRGHLVPITMKFASFYLDWGIYAQTHSLYTRVIERNPNPSNDRERHLILEATEGLAIVELLQGEFRIAEKHCREAIHGYEALPAEYAPSRLRALHNLGEICGAQGKFSAILDLFNQSLQGSKELFGESDLVTLREVEAYGNAHRVLRQYDEASALYERAIEGMKAVFETEDHPDLLGAMEGLAIVRKGQERYSESEALYRTVLEGNIEQLGKNHPDTINVVEELGDVYAAQQMVDRARPLYEQAREARIMVVGEQHPDTLRVIKKMNELLYPTGEVDFVHDTTCYCWYRAITSREVEDDRTGGGHESIVESVEESSILEIRPKPSSDRSGEVRDDHEQVPSSDLSGLPGQAPTQRSENVPSQIPLSSALILFDERDSPAGAKDVSVVRSKEFFRLFEGFREQHKAYWGLGPRIKVAILDTGFDREESATRGYTDRIRNERRRRNGGRRDDPIKAIRSFVGDAGEDSCGHGTRVAQLILRLAPQADLYVAKVSKGLSDGDVKSPEFVENAIDWAVALGVDIITMSFGLASWDNKVSAALRRASASSILFAAPSNWGGNRPRPFPANDSNVICVHASDGFGNDSGGMNPSTDGLHDKWTTLGVGLQFDWYGRPIYKSGASYATPIAVAMVVNALDFVNFLGAKGKLPPNRREYLLRHDGICRMLWLMSEERDGFRYVAPWKLWEGPWSEEKDEDYVCQRLATDRS